MARINDTTTYPNTAPALGDYVIGTDVSDTTNSTDGEVVTFTMQAILDAFALGYNQTWQDVTASRSASTTYTNNTGKPIFVSVVNNTADGGIAITVDGSIRARNGQSAGGGDDFHSVTSIVPNGSTYSITTYVGSSLSWHELR